MLNFPLHISASTLKNILISRLTGRSFYKTEHKPPEWHSKCNRLKTARLTERCSFYALNHYSLYVQAFFSFLLSFDLSIIFSSSETLVSTSTCFHLHPTF